MNREAILNTATHGDFWSSAVLSIKALSFALLIPLFLLSATTEDSISEPAALFPPLLADIHVGERAELSFKWMGWEVAGGEILLKEKVQHRGRDAWHVILRVQTTKVLSILFPVRDEYHSFIDIHTLQSLRFEKTIAEGNYRADEVVDFDHDLKKGFYFSRLNKSEKTFETASIIHDPISAVYWYRAFMPLEVGDVRNIPINYDECNWDIQVPILEREEIEAGVLGTRNALKMKPFISNLDSHITDWEKDHQKMLRGSRITVWVDEGKNRIPLRASVKVPFVGSVKIDVTDYNAASKP